MKLKQAKLLMALLAMTASISAIAAPHRTVSNPMAYSENQSKFFAEGDSNDSSGWRGCRFDDSEGESVTHILCEGTREILVHGGKMVTVPFYCHFIFSPRLQGRGGYYFEAGECR